jgi:flagellar biosynthesis GTPase FlhF
MNKIANIQKIVGAGGLGADLILKGISKIAPGLGSFVLGARSAGYAADQVVDFLKSKFTTAEEKRNLARLSEKSAQGTARPDQRAELSQFEQSMAPFETAGSIGKVGLQAYGGKQVANVEANQQQQAQQMQEQEMAMQQQAQQQQQAMQQASQQEKQSNQQYQRERQLEKDVERRAQQQRQENRFDAQIKYRLEEQENRRKEQLSKKESGTKKSAQTNTLKNLGNPPSQYIDAMRELDEFINRLP